MRQKGVCLRDFASDSIIDFCAISIAAEMAPDFVQSAEGLTSKPHEKDQ